MKPLAALLLALGVSVSVWAEDGDRDLSAAVQDQIALVDAVEAKGSADQTAAAVTALESRTWVLKGRAVKVTDFSESYYQVDQVYRIESMVPDLPWESTLEYVRPYEGGRPRSIGKVLGEIRYSVVRAPDEGRYYLVVRALTISEGMNGSILVKKTLDQRAAYFIAGQRDKLERYYPIGGEGPAGGIVFWVEGKKNMEVFPRFMEETTWAGASRACADSTQGGCQDWRLPTKDELNLIFTRLSGKGIFFRDYYWTSDEADSRHAWYQSLATGDQYPTDKEDYALVCPVRLF